jgi:2-oxoglutarate dehydrogenase E1 component
VYYPLAAARDERAVKEVGIARVEQLYPFPRPEIEAVLARYRNAADVCWVQEEPRNMGAWSFLEPRLRELLPPGSKLSYVGRDEAASPAVGSFRLHQVEEDTFVRQSLDVAPVAAVRAKLPPVKSAAAAS